MANKIETLRAGAIITAPPEKFLNFYKYNMAELVKIFPAAFTEVLLLEGEEGTVGCIKQFKYVVGGISMSAKLLIEAIDDDAKSITFSAIDGDVLLLYKSFKTTHTFTNGSADCIISFERATLITPPPLLYVPLVVAIYTLVDAYLHINV